MDTASGLADDGEEADESCDFSYSHYPPVQLPLDSTRHIKQPLKGFTITPIFCVLHYTSHVVCFTVNKSAKSSASAVKPNQDKEISHVPTAAELFLNPVCYCKKHVNQ